MSCKDKAEFLVDTDLSECPAELREHIENCAECSAALEGQRFVRRILAVKRHEQAAPGVADEIAAGVRAKLFAAEKSDLSRFRFADLRWFIKPAFQMTAAALIIVLAGSFFFRGHNTSTPPVMTRHAEFEHELDLPRIGRTAPEWLLENTNTAPEQIRYGPLRSRLVDFELDAPNSE